ncbi:hypothetical protein GCM10009547_06520 [Sporichthya brevicatena]|uniref:Uncharacterized protein n=1 Tax=Sporichthya brevicatena TaxID=171442 RepID=A0ABN1GA54_9ACTN
MAPGAKQAPAATASLAATAARKRDTVANAVPDSAVNDIDVTLDPEGELWF